MYNLTWNDPLFQISSQSLEIHCQQTSFYRIFNHQQQQCLQTIWALQNMTMAYTNCFGLSQIGHNMVPVMTGTRKWIWVCGNWCCYHSTVGTRFIICTASAALHHLPADAATSRFLRRYRLKRLLLRWWLLRRWLLLLRWWLVMAAAAALVTAAVALVTAAVAMVTSFHPALPGAPPPGCRSPREIDHLLIAAVLRFLSNREGLFLFLW
jgi:hypothetical protein